MLEKSILASMAENESALMQGIDEAKVEMFTIENHRVIFKAMKVLFDAGQDVGMMTLYEALPNYADILADLLNTGTATSKGIAQHLKMLKTRYMRHQTGQLGTKILSMASDMEIATEEILANVEADLYKIQNMSSIMQSTTTIKDSVALIIEDMENAANGNFPVIKTGINAYDDLFGGIYQNELILLAARPSVGKTALSLQISSNIAKRGKKVAYFTLEIDSKAVVRRLIASESGISIPRLKNGLLTKAEQHRFADGVNKLYELPITFIERQGLYCNEVRSICYKLKKDGLDVVVIDYLSLMIGDKSVDHRLQISGMTKLLKQTAKELKIPIILLHQLSRSCESRSGFDKRPILSDLAESAGIEADADAVWFLFSPYNARLTTYPDFEGGGSVEKTDVELIVAKNRDGERNRIVKLSFDGESQTFTDRINSAPEF
jgi:replicative DNA helicase